jgi:hypothetical protein
MNQTCAALIVIVRRFHVVAGEWGGEVTGGLKVFFKNREK